MKKQQGVVIIVALFFVGLVAAMSLYMMGRLERDTRRTQLLLRNVNAELYAQGSLQWAIAILKTNMERQKPNQVVDKLPYPSPVDEVNGYRISSVIYDAQSRFNLNNLTDSVAQMDFKKLLQLLAPDLSPEKMDEIVMATADWIAPGEPQNQLNKYYLHLSPPYRAGHKLMASRTEWQHVKGVTPALYQALEKYVVALPVTTPVNVLTAPGAVLAALHPTMTLATGLAIQKICQKSQPPTAEAFLAMDILKNQNPHIEKDKITTISTYFLVETTVEIEDQRMVLYTLVGRISNNGKSSMAIVWQSKSVSG